MQQDKIRTGDSAMHHTSVLQLNGHRLIVELHEKSADAQGQSMISTRQRGNAPDELHLGYLLQQRMRLSLCGGGGGGGACVYVLVKKIRLARLAMISA